MSISFASRFPPQSLTSALEPTNRESTFSLPFIPFFSLYGKGSPVKDRPPSPTLTTASGV